MGRGMYEEDEMAETHDRYESEGGAGFVMGLLAGTVLGAGIGMLLAPRAGSELRGQLGAQARNFGNRAADQYRKAGEVASEWAGRGREMVDKAREAVSHGAEEVRGYASATTGSTQSSFGGGTTDSTGPRAGTDFGRP